MVINFPNNPVDQQIFENDGKIYIYDATKQYWRGVINYQIPSSRVTLYKLFLIGT